MRLEEKHVLVLVAIEDAQVFQRGKASEFADIFQWLVTRAEGYSVEDYLQIIRELQDAELLDGFRLSPMATAVVGSWRMRMAAGQTPDLDAINGSASIATMLQDSLGAFIKEHLTKAEQHESSGDSRSSEDLEGGVK